MIISQTFKQGPKSILTFLGPDGTVSISSLKIYGKSEQNGAPTTENPVPISYVASGGTLVLTVVGGGNTQTISIPVSAGLKGLKYYPTPYKYLINGDGDYLADQNGDRLMAR